MEDIKYLYKNFGNKWIFAYCILTRDGLRGDIITVEADARWSDDEKIKYGLEVIKSEALATYKLVNKEGGQNE